MENIEENPKSKSSNMPLIIGVLVAVAAIGGFLLMRGGQQTTSQNEAQLTPTLAEENTNIEEADGGELGSEVGEPTIIDIDAVSFSYNPSEIRVKKSETVQINITAKDAMHDFNIDELEIKVPVTTAGETNSVTFVADKAGEFEYYCSVGQHRQNGQVGKLIVEE